MAVWYICSFHRHYCPILEIKSVLFAIIYFVLFFCFGINRQLIFCDRLDHISFRICQLRYSYFVKGNSVSWQYIIVGLWIYQIILCKKIPKRFLFYDNSSRKSGSHPIGSCVCRPKLPIFFPIVLSADGEKNKRMLWSARKMTEMIHHPWKLNRAVINPLKLLLDDMSRLICQNTEA